MAESSFRKIIADYPLNDALDHLKPVLRKIEESDYLDESEFKVPTNPRRLVGATGQLLFALGNHEAAFKIRSRQNGPGLNTELNSITRRITREFNYDHFRPLVKFILKPASDLDIWTAVLNLITKYSQVTPPPSAPASLDGTPISRSTSSFIGNEQTKRLLDVALKYELKGRIYRNVEGFHKKYFESSEWSERSTKIYEVIRRSHIDGRWVNFPDPPEQDAVWKWLEQLQDDHLAEARGAYYTIKNPSELEGDSARRQLDIFLMRKNKDKSSCSKHNWKDVLVIGEHKQSSQGPNELLLQLSRYMRDVFYNQPTRRFVHGFFIHGSKMELWVFDRSGPYSSGEFDIHREPERFIQSIVGYAHMSDEELGLDTFIQRRAETTYLTLENDARGKKRKLQLDLTPFVKQNAIVCRGTTCFRTKDHENVVKFSWTSDKRLPEAEHLTRAHERCVEGVAKFIGYHRITSISELRSGLIFGHPWAMNGGTRIESTSTQSYVSHSLRLLQVSNARGSECFQISTPDSEPDVQKLGDEELRKRKSFSDETSSSKKARPNTQISKLHQALNEHDSNSLYETYDNRLFGCLAVSPAGRSLNEFSSIRELLTALRDAIKAHKSLYIQGDILHRDISENNIIVTDPKTAKGFTGMLIDLDLAKVVGAGKTGARHQTGTMEFMAIQVLRKVAHTYRHDLESFFYVLLWICGRRAWERKFQCSPKERPKRDALKKWYHGDFEDIAEAKQGHMHADGFDQILSQFPAAFDYVKPLCSRIRQVLFPLTEDGKLDLGTPTEPEKLYDAIIGEFDAAITGCLKD